MRRLTVERVAHGEEIAQAGERVAHLKQGAILVVAQAAKDFLGIGAQIHHLAPRTQVLAVVRPEHGPASGGQDPGVGARQVIDDLLLDVAEGFFALALKKLADRAAYTLLNRRVRIYKTDIKPARELTSNGGFSGAREADKCDQ